MPDASARDAYKQRADVARQEDAYFDGWSAVVGNGRVLLLLVAGGLALWHRSNQSPQPTTLYWILGGVFFVSFVVQDQIDRRRDRARLRVLHYERAMDRLAGLWRKFPQQGKRFDDANHPYARDLDVVGQGSLFQLLDTTRTLRGEATLASWLLRASPLTEIEARRASAQALAKDLDARERLAIAGLDKEVSRIEEESLLSWVDGEEIFTAPPALVWAARLLPVATITFVVLGYLDIAPTKPIWVLLAAHLALLARTRGQVEKLGAIADKTEVVGSSRVDLQACKLEYSIVSPK